MTDRPRRKPTRFRTNRLRRCSQPSFPRHRPLRAEFLEPRTMLALAAATPWTNSLNPLDVDGDTFVAPIDAVLVINYLNAAGSKQLSATYVAPEPYYDVDSDTFVSPIDAVLVINALNASASRAVIAVEEAAVAGVAFDDRDSDGIFEPAAGETPLVGRTVYLDLNRNGRLDSPAEPSQITGANGAYAFSDLPPGSYRVAQVETRDWTQTFPLQTAARVRTVTQAANDLVYDPVGGKIYASVPSSVGASGNSVAVIDPVTGAVTASVFVGSEPGKLAISDNGQYLYVALMGANAVRRVDLTTLTAGLQFSLGSLQVEDMEVMPGSPHTVAISLYQPGFSPRTAGIAIYDDGVQRPQTAGGGNVIEFSANPTILYGYDSESSRHGFGRMVVTPQGLTGTTYTEGIIGGPGGDIEYDNGRVYSTNANVIDPEAGTIVARLTQGSLEPDSSRGLTFYLGGPVLKAFDQETFLQVGALTLSGVGDTAYGLIRWGATGLALRSTTGQIVLVEWDPRAASHPVTLAANQSVEGLDFGSRTTVVPKSINGQAFYDFDGNGTAGSGEPRLAGWTVFLDSNGNGQLDSSERSTTTNGIGGYSFSNLGPGSYAVALTPRPGWELTSPTPQAARVRLANVLANDVAYDAVSGKIYASTPSSWGIGGNSIAVIDPVTAAVEATIFVGSEPGEIEISDDGRYLYVALTGAGAVRRVDLTTRTAGLQFSLGSLQVEDMEVMPGSARTVAISRYQPGRSPRSEGIAIYDDGVQRPQTAGGGNVIEFGASPTVLYGYDAESSLHGFARMVVTPQGLSGTTYTEGIIGGPGGDIEYDNGRVYSTNANVIDPEAGTVVARLTQGSLEPVASRGLTYFLNGTQLRAFDQQTFLPVGTTTVGGVTDTAYGLIHWGTTGLAFRTSSGQVVLTEWDPRTAPGLRFHTIHIGSGPSVNNRDFGLVNTAPVNPPIVLGESYTIVEGSTLTVPAPGVLANDSDPNNDPLTAHLVSGISGGGVSMSSSGSFTVTPSANFSGVASFTYRVFDGQSLQQATVTITVTPVNDAPVAANNSYSTAEDTPRVVTGTGVLAGDSDPDGDSLTALLVAGPARGVLSFSPEGRFTYTPEANHAGTVTFTYRASDGQLTSNVATVTITISAVNDAPLAAGDAYATTVNSLFSVSAPGVLANDSDVEGSSLSALLVTGPANGVLSLAASGAFTYAPASNFIGTDSFTYRARDGQLNSPVATVALTVVSANSPPTAVDDTFTVVEDNALSVAAPGVLANDTAPSAAALTADIVAGPLHGTLLLLASGSFTYTPAFNFFGPDSFTYRASDGTRLSEIATVTLDVTPGNAAPLTARLIRDINIAPGGVQIDGDSLIDFHGVAYFAGSIGGGDVELWRSDGTTAGTRRVRDIRPGPIGSKPNNLTAVDGLIFFGADAGDGGYELWKSDGSENGTVLVKDIQPGLHGSYPRNFLNVNSTLFFAANDGTSGYELWRSDGSTSGTMLVKDIAAGQSSSYLRYFTNVSGRLFFAANDGVTGYELWKSDGAETGTTLVKDIRPGVYPYSFVRELTNVNGMLFFRHDDGEHGAELWKSDGSETGTTQVLDIRPGINGSNPRSLAAVNGTLFFAASADGGESVLWKSDGTAAGTVRTDNASTPGSTSPQYLTNVNGRLFFFAQSGLWTSDGAGAALTQLKQLEAPSGFLDRRYLVNVDGTLFFRAGDGAHGQELWRTDGTPEGTTLLQDTIGGIEGGEPRLLTNVGGRLFFAASDGTSDAELWTSNGSAAGTAHVVVPGATTASAAPAAAVTIGDVAFFAATDAAGGRELWKTDGTAAGTVRVADIVPGPSGSSPRYLTRVGGTLYFTADNGASGRELWKTDGTAAGTTLVRDIRPGNESSSPHDLVNVGGTLFFSANDGTSGYELWKSDVAAGAALVTNIRPGAAASYPRGLTNVNGTLLFRANDGITGFELWKSEGTAAGAVLVSDIRAGAASSYLHYLTNVNGTLFFAASGGESGVELWKSDGSSAGTMLVRDIRLGGASSLPRFLTNVNGQLFFRATDGLTGEELWKSDGTFGGTVLVRNIRSGSFDSEPAYLTNVGGTLFFSASGNANNVELWKSDGTALGTALVAEIGAGDIASFPSLLVNVGGRLFFSAETAASGRELWTSDGTAAGTFQVADIAAEGASSLPSDITDFRGRPLFTADDGQLGRELWTVGDDIAVNQPPVAASDSYVTLEDTPFVIAAPGLLANDTDADGDALAARLEAGPAHGTLSLDADGGFRYLPAADFHGLDSFTYRADDGTVASDVAKVTITIAPVSDAPVISLSGGAPALEGSPFTGSGSFTDADGNAWTATVDYGDGSPAQPLTLNADQTFALSHVYVDNGVFGVTVVVTSASGAAGSATLVADIGNVAPHSLTFSGPALAGRGQTHSYFGTFTDPGLGDTHTARIDWGDGSVTTHAVSGTGAARQVAASHAYQASGIFQPTLTIIDDDGGAASKQATVLVGGSGLDRGVIEIVGSAQADNITVAVTEGRLQIFGSLGGATLSQSFAIGSVQRVVALLGGGNDMLTVSSTVTVPLLIDGGNGNDTLFAGGGPAILIGGSGNDALRGGGHRDLLIGGVGLDQMNAAGGGDLLVAGRTAYDTNHAALEAILAEWSAAGTYQERITRLRAGNGGIVQPLGVKLANVETVFEDTVVDTLWGGSELDWFFYEPSQDQPLDKLASEINR